MARTDLARTERQQTLIAAWVAWHGIRRDGYGLRTLGSASASAPASFDRGACNREWVRTALRREERVTTEQNSLTSCFRASLDSKGSR